MPPRGHGSTVLTSNGTFGRNRRSEKSRPLALPVIEGRLEMVGPIPSGRSCPRIGGSRAWPSARRTSSATKKKYRTTCSGKPRTSCAAPCSGSRSTRARSQQRASVSSHQRQWPELVAAAAPTTTSRPVLAPHHRSGRGCGRAGDPGPASAAFPRAPAPRVPGILIEVWAMRPCAPWGSPGVRTPSALPLRHSRGDRSTPVSETSLTLTRPRGFAF